MHERMERAARLRVGCAFEFAPDRAGEKAGDEMMLVGESGDCETVCFTRVRRDSPIDMRCDIAAARLHSAVMR